MGAGTLPSLPPPPPNAVVVDAALPIPYSLLYCVGFDRRSRSRRIFTNLSASSSAALRLSSSARTASSSSRSRPTSRIERKLGFAKEANVLGLAPATAAEAAVAPLPFPKVLLVPSGPPLPLFLPTAAVFFCCWAAFKAA